MTKRAQPLTERQQKYAETRLLGAGPVKAARMAGYWDNGGSGIRVLAYRLERNPKVRGAMEMMTKAICQKALELIRDKRPVSLMALKFLAESPDITPAMKVKVARLQLQAACGRDVTSD